MAAESDEAFVERISREVYPGFDGWRTVSMMDHSLDRLFALARRGAAAIADDKCKKDPRTFVSDAGSPFRADAPSPFASIATPPPTGETNE